MNFDWMRQTVYERGHAILLGLVWASRGFCRRSMTSSWQRLEIVFTDRLGSTATA